MKTFWKDYRGKSIKICDLPDQHLSNIYWNSLVMGSGIDPDIFAEIERRDGPILSYSPDQKFLSEIKYLESNGFLVWKKTPSKEVLRGIITFENEVIGIIFKDVINVLFKSEDGVDIKEGDSWWYVKLPSLAGPTKTSTLSYDGNNKKEVLRFSTQSAAHEYILTNKKLLSFNDIQGFLSYSETVNIFNLVKKRSNEN